MTVRPAKTQISLGIRLIWSESPLCAHWVAKDPSFRHAVAFVMRTAKTLIEWADHTGWMPRLIWVCAVRTVTLLILSFRGSSSLILCFPHNKSSHMRGGKLVIYWQYQYNWRNVNWILCLNTVHFRTLLQYLNYIQTHNTQQNHSLLFHFQPIIFVLIIVFS